MLVPFLLRELPMDTIRNIARDHESSNWTMEELQEALLREIRIFETVIISIYLESPKILRSSYKAHREIYGPIFN